MTHETIRTLRPSAPIARTAGASSMRATLTRWFDTASPLTLRVEAVGEIDWLRAMPFVLLHLGCLAVFWVGVSAASLWVAGALYAVRMFALTGFYHRYFSHRTFKTSRAVQFFFALLGASSVQRGPLWWAAHHRAHHRHADTALDPHSPTLTGFFWSHAGWFLTSRAFETDWARIPDLRKLPELRWLNRYDTMVPLGLAVLLFAVGVVLQQHAPRLGVTGWQLLVWGFFVSTVVLFHATVTINSLAHRYGRRRFATPDDSRNNLFLALITFGEGWHNNHHFYPGSTRQGFRWYEVDFTWYGLRALAALGLVWNLKPVPGWVAGKASG